TSHPSPSQSPKRSSDSFSRPGSLAGVGLAARFQDLINETPFLCFLGRHEAVTLQRLFDFAQLAARVFNIDLVQAALEFFGFTRMDQDISRLSLESSRRLVDHDAAVGQREAHPRLARTEQKRPHRGR